MDRLHDTRAPFLTGIAIDARVRQVQDPNGGSRVRFCFWPHRETLLSWSLSFLAAKETLYLYHFSVVQFSTQSIKTKQLGTPKNQSSQTCEYEAGNSLVLHELAAFARRSCVGGSTDEGLYKDLVAVDRGGGGGGRLSLVSMTWWSASFAVHCGRRVRQTLFHTVRASGTVRRDKERVVFRVGSC